MTGDGERDGSFSFDAEVSSSSSSESSSSPFGCCDGRVFAGWALSVFGVSLTGAV